MEILKLILSQTITLIVGGIAIYLYLKQRAVERRDAAKLIIQEIRYAEQQIRNFRDSGSYTLSAKLLPTNNWHDKINLFVKDLTESEIDLISRFYSTAAYIDTLIGKISDQKNSAVIPVKKIRTSQQPQSDNATPSMTPLAIPIETQAFDFNTQIILLEISTKAEFIYNTPAIDKLRAISDKKMFWFI